MFRMPVRTTVLALIAATGSVVCLSGFAAAQTTPATRSTPTADSLRLPGEASESQVVSKPGTMRLMSRPITVKFTETRLEDCMKFVADFTGAPIEVAWAEGNSEGLDKELAITMDIKGVPALHVLERLLDKAKTDFSDNTWQMTDEGSIECGPKSVLNKHKRLEIYDIQDMLFEIQRYDEVPQIDLQSLLQQSQGGGGGGGQSPFRDDQQDQERNREELEQRAQDRANDLIALITSLVEPDQWSDAGGEGGTVKLFQKTIIVNAPDYMHRAVDGYKWWGRGHKSYKIADRRYVSLNMGAENGTVDGIRNFPVSAVVGGRVISSDPSRNPPGGSTTPADGPKQKKAADKKAVDKKVKPAPKKAEPAKKTEAKKPEEKK